jgi:hypothetical protein
MPDHSVDTDIAGDNSLHAFNDYVFMFWSYKKVRLLFLSIIIWVTFCNGGRFSVS